MISSGNLIRFSSYAFLFGDGWMISMHLKAKQNKKITEKHTNCFWRLAASPRNGPERNCDNSVSFRITHSVSSRNDSNSAFQCSEFDSKRFLQIKQEKRRKKQQWEKISLWNENEKSEKKKNNIRIKRMQPKYIERNVYTDRITIASTRIRKICRSDQRRFIYFCLFGKSKWIINFWAILSFHFELANANIQFGCNSFWSRLFHFCSNRIEHSDANWRKNLTLNFHFPKSNEMFSGSTFQVISFVFIHEMWTRVYHHRDVIKPKLFDFPLVLRKNNPEYFENVDIFVDKTP